MSTDERLDKLLTADASPQSVLWANFVAPLFDRSEPHVRVVEAPYVTQLDELLPFATIRATVRGDRVELIEADVGEATVLAQRYSQADDGIVWIRAATIEAADKAEAEIRAQVPPVPTTDGAVMVDFWQVDGGDDAYTSPRAIDAPPLDDILVNYPGPVGEQLLALAAREPKVDDGRIVLWHGPPGTGKTTAIRSLARAWKDRIQVQVLLDPERVLAGSGHLMSVLLDGSSEAWRLLVIEDADELLRVDAKERVGQSLSRLLNLSDGLLGQGVKVLVLMTTNEPIGRIHPALIRPGRCLAETEFRRFTRAEAITRAEATTRTGAVTRARAMARTGGPLPSGATFSLAELIAIDDGEAPAVDDVGGGAYL